MLADRLDWNLERAWSSGKSNNQANFCENVLGSMVDHDMMD
jgi:hypothetical protein